jgi:DNA gyrase subunit B
MEIMNHQIVDGQQERFKHITATDGVYMTNKASYDAKDIRVLEEIEHIRLNSGMYIGHTQNPVHLIEEVLDNALDEALAGHAKIVAVIVDTKENKFSVLDNGRGIPISNNTPVTISAKLFSGAKFQDKKTAYEISSGLHGVGLVAVNALSTNYNIEIYRKEKFARYTFENAKLKFSKVEEYKGTKPFSTKIEFKPDKKYFESLKPDLDRIRKRLTTASAEMPDDITFVLIVDGKKELFKLSKIDHFVLSCLDSKPEQLATINLNSVKSPEKFEVIFAYEKESSTTPRVISSVNLLPVHSGGSHVNYFFDTIKEFFITKAKKYDLKFQPNDALCGLRAYLMLSLIEPKFSSQTKESLINPKTYFEKFGKDIVIQLEDFATKNEDMLLELLERFQEYRQRLDSKKLTVDRTNGRRASTKYTKLRDCTSRNGELYIVEGDSAGGSIIQSRNPAKHAVLPLRGKSIPNVTTKKEILKNVEVSELIMSMGTGVGPHFDLTKLRYSKIVCATDADHDGNHIACLVSMVMAILLPEIVKSGKYFIAQTPLFAINEGKTFIPLWTSDEVDKARKAGRKLTRFKGLGELTPAQLKVCLLDEGTRNFIPVTYSDNVDDLVKLFSSADEKRKLVVGN